MSTVEGLRATISLTRPDGFALQAELVVEPGETVALLGPNGAGKSTAIAALAGLVRLDAGRIDLAGRVLDNPAGGTFVAPRARRIGVVFQDHLLFASMGVLDNVAFGPRSRGATRRRARAIAHEWLAHVGLADMAARRPQDLSGGQAQRVALARALASEPDLLLLDEPLSALDVTTRARVRRDLGHHLARFPGPRLVITHDPTEAFLMADRVVVLEDGRVTQVGTPDDIRLRPATPYAADLAGANLVMGVAADGQLDTGTATLHLADQGVTGPVLVTIQPTAVTVHTTPPQGSQRNTWATTIERMEVLGDRVRLGTGPPVPLAVEVTRSAVADLDLAVGGSVWLAVKATELGVQPDPGG